MISPSEVKGKGEILWPSIWLDDCVGDQYEPQSLDLALGLENFNEIPPSRKPLTFGPCCR